MKYKIGFSTGALHKHQNTVNALKTIARAGCECVELGFVRCERLQWGWLEQVERVDLDSFSYVSFHAPKHDYGSNETTKVILNTIAAFHTKIRALDVVVIHPDPIQDFSALEDSGLPIGIENMDRRKTTGQRPESLQPILSRYPDWKLVLDVNHVFTNDPSMQLANRLRQTFQQRIAQIHLSGYREYHEPLFKTQQTDIIEAAKGLKVPIIIESVLSPDSLVRERDYVLAKLES